MKQFKWLLLLVVFALVATACGDDDADETTAAPSDTTVAAETTAAPDDGGTDTTAAPDTTEAMVDLSGTSVSIFSSEDGVDEATGIQRALDVFASESGIEITHSGARDFSEQINAQAVGGNPPDIAMFPQPGKVKDFAAQGYILPLPAAVDAAVRPQWPAGTLETYSVDGTAYAVQAKTDLKSIVWYNTQVFADGGYEVPTTLGALVELGNQMIADGQTPWCVGIESGPATGWTFTDWMEDMMLRIEGPEAYDRWTSNELAFDDPSVIAVAQTILDIWNTPGNTYAAGGSIAATAHSADHGDPLVAGTCAMVRQASFFAAFLPEGTTVGPDGQIDTFYFPAADASSSPVLTAGNSAAAFRDAPEVWAVIEYLGSTQYAEERQKAQREIKGGDASGVLTANLNVDLSLWNTLEAGFIEILTTANPARFDGSDLMPAAVGSGSFWTEGTSAVNGDKSVEDAFKAIEASWP
ncbi:MAG: ABC transporter substrate-binding protein [Acidimicrobiia bacterium]|nr:ABC transporter substrate-binding protein [Acidimicrobiia bacterium]MDX2468409.1 ABC transporter substrate-binding protein [Acidimicrobiia bacterium]